MFADIFAQHDTAERTARDRTYLGDARNAHEELERAESGRQQNLLVLQPIKFVDEGASHRLEHCHLQRRLPR